MKLPQALGHEILGEITAAGPDAEGVEIGKTMLVYKAHPEKPTIKLPR